ncbi:MAG TPA: hypothetical protein VLB68_17230 [Pyrinomonadaceae bacterium]|nr:hypothetical protein [Pyrinomonadaceae bacterium]
MSATPKSQQQPIVFVVDDDISVRESLESLIAHDLADFHYFVSVLFLPKRLPDRRSRSCAQV